MQTEEISIVQLKADIEKLEAQRDTLKRTIDAYAIQTEELYQKRSVVAQECEVLKLGIDEERKKINIERGSLEGLRREIQKEDQKLKASQVRFSEDKESFKEERRVYGLRLQEVEKSEKEIFQTKEALRKKEGELLDLQSDLDQREKKFQKESASLRDELTGAKNMATSSASQSKLVLEQAEAAKQDFETRKEGLERSFEEEKKKFDQKVKVWEADTAARTEALRKRELALVQKEKDAENLKNEYKTRIENIEIDEARKREEPKEEKKKKK